MAQNPFDQLAKQYLEEFLASAGQVVRNLEVPGQAKFVDVFFAPHSNSSLPPNLGLLGRMTQRVCSLEPFRNAPTRQEVRTCILKLLWLQEEERRKAKQEEEKLAQDDLPQLWILAATTSQPMLRDAGATTHPDWPDGVYWLPPLFKTAIISIDHLPETQETLWLRILGRGPTQEQAIREVLALPKDHPRRDNILRLLASWKVRMDLSELEDFDERGTVMVLSQAFLEWEQATQSRSIQQGLQQGERSLLQRLLTARFGPLSESVIAAIASLNSAQVESLSLALFDFTELADVEAWLAPEMGRTLIRKLTERFGDLPGEMVAELQGESSGEPARLLARWVALVKDLETLETLEVVQGWLDEHPEEPIASLETID